MKRMIVSAFMLAAFATAGYAQDAKTAPAPAGAVATAQQENRTKVDPSTLPDAVKATLKNDDYKDWTVTGAWMVKTTPAFYLVELKKDDKTTTLNIGDDGKVK